MAVDDRWDDIFEYRQIYVDARDDVFELVRAKVQASDTNQQFELFERVADWCESRRISLLKTAVFELLLGKYRRDRKLTRRQLRQKMLAGEFWDDFLKFLQSIDWAAVLELIMEIIAMIIGLL